MYFEEDGKQDLGDYDHEYGWAHGEHQTSNGHIIRLKDMSTPHLINTIHKFEYEGYDVSALEKELKKRKHG